MRNVRTWIILFFCSVTILLPSSGWSGSSQSIIFSCSSLEPFFQLIFVISSSTPRSDGGADEQRERIDKAHAVFDDGKPAAHSCSANWRNASSRLRILSDGLFCKLCLFFIWGTCVGDVARVKRRPRRRRDCSIWLGIEVCVLHDADDDTTGFSTRKRANRKNTQKHKTEVERKN